MMIKDETSILYDITDKMNPAGFEEVARSIMSEHFKCDLIRGKLHGVPKLFDFVSTDEGTVGDAKYLTMVRGYSIPPAKFSMIAEYVWLLEKLPAKNKFLVFGNDKRVPEEWLKRYGIFVNDVEFYFIDIITKKLEKLERRKKNGISRKN
jgi:hypothetical protein